MATTNVAVAYEKRKGSWELSAGDKHPKLTVSLVVGYTVTTNNTADTEDDILTNALFPQPNQNHPSYAYARATAASVEQTDNANIWRGTVTYRSDAPDTDSDDESPTDWAPRWERDASVEMTYPAHDLNGNAFVNSAGYPYRTAPGIPKSRPRHIVTLYRNTYNEAHCDKYEHKVNDSNYTMQGKTYVANTVLCDRIKISQQQVNGNAFYQYTYELLINVDKDDTGNTLGWQGSFLSQGVYDIDGSTINDIKGRPVTDDVPLSNAGYALSVEDKTEGSYHYKHYTIRNTANFAGMLTNSY